MSKPRFHLRSVFKWVGLLSCVLLVGLSVQAWKAREFISYYRNGVYFRLGPGSLLVTSKTDWGPLNYLGVSRLVDSHESFPLWPRIATGKWGATHGTIPSWMLLSMFAIPTAILWWRDRRPKAGFCMVCEYDLTGNVSGTCPECGTAYDASQRVDKPPSGGI